MNVTPAQREAHSNNPPVSMNDRQAALEADLQFLLDAQADGLIRGLDGGDMDNQSATTGSATPTIRSLKSTASTAINPARKRKMSLKRARRGIHNTIIALSSVKENELEAIDSEVQAKDHLLAQIEEWEQKRRGLREAAKGVDDTEDMVRAQRLRKEADSLQTEINNVELQLAEMKARHRNLSRQVAASENAVQARLASYSHSLDQLSVDIQKFLSLPQTSNTSSRPVNDFQPRSSMWALPQRRRNLSLAGQELKEEREAIIHYRAEVEQEKTALSEGAKVWRNVLQLVEEFEAELRQEMASLSVTTPSAHDVWNDELTRAPTSHVGMGRLLERLEGVIEAVEKEDALAESKGWKLLIAAIGAELHALMEGRAVLLNALGADEENEDDPPQDLLGETEGDDDPKFQTEKSTANLRGSVSHSRQATQARDADTETDEDPDPELMFSRQGVED